MREADLEKEYDSAFAEFEDSGDAALWDQTSGDGIDDLGLRHAAPTKVAPGGTRCYLEGMSAQPEFLPEEITQRDLRNRSKEIMDAVAHGHGFTVTRNGHRIGELIPLRRRRRFVPKAEFVAMSRHAPVIDLAAFRADQDAGYEDDPYER
jgi:prevent-host-death family protein